MVQHDVSDEKSANYFYILYIRYTRMIKMSLIQPFSRYTNRAYTFHQKSLFFINFHFKNGLL